MGLRTSTDVQPDWIPAQGKRSHKSSGQKKKKSVLNVSPIPQPVSIARQASEDASSPQQLSCKSQVSDLLPKAPDTLELIAIAAVL